MARSNKPAGRQENCNKSIPAQNCIFLKVQQMQVERADLDVFICSHSNSSHIVNHITVIISNRAVPDTVVKVPNDYRHTQARSHCQITHRSSSTRARREQICPCTQHLHTHQLYIYGHTL